MDPMTIAALVGGGLGLAKNYGFDQPEANRQRQYQATVARFSPWTKQQAAPVGNPNPLGSTMQGALGGAAIGQQIGQQPASAPGQPYSGPPAVPQPAAPSLTPSGYDPNSGESYTDYLTRYAMGGAGPARTTSPYSGLGGQ